MSQIPSNLSAAERASFLDQWITQRMDQAKAMEERIDGRLAFLEKTEQGLKALHEAIRRQVADAMPVLNALSQLRRESQELGAQIEQARTDAHALSDGELAAARRAVEQLQTDAQLAAARLRGETQGAMQALRDDTQQVVQRAQAQLEICRSGARDLAEVVDGTIRDAMAGVMEKAESAVRPLAERLERQVDQAQRQAEQAVASAEYALAARAGTFEASLIERCNGLSRKHDALAEEITRHSSACLDATAAAMQRHLAQTVDDLRVQARHMHADLQQTAAELKQTLREETLASRRMLEDHLHELMVQVDQMLDGSAARLGRRTDAIRSQVIDAVESAARMLTERMAQMEQEVQSRTSWLQRRLEQRLAELTDRSNHALRAQPKTPAPVEVQVFVDDEGQGSRHSRVA